MAPGITSFLVNLGLFSPAVATAQTAGEVALVADSGGDIISSAFLASTYLGRTACKFYESFPDQYDALFVFTSARLNALNRSPTGWTVKSPAQGIGRDVYPDSSARYCTTRLRHAVKTGDIDSFDDDPAAVYEGQAAFTMSGLEVLGHEFGHQWMAGVSFDQGDGQRRCLLRAFTGTGEDTAPSGADACDGHRVSDFGLHWSYYLSSSSVMYGNHIEDLGGGEFRFSNLGTGFTPFDQYLMGLRDPSEVPPMFLVEPESSNDTPSSAFPLPLGQVETRRGARLDFTIADVIRAEGPRVPVRENCHWKAAFVIVHPPNAPPSAAQIAKVDRYRVAFEAWYATATDRRGSIDTTLAGSGEGTAECPAQGPPIDPRPDAGDREDAATPADAGPVDVGFADVGFADVGAGAAEPQTLYTAEGCACEGDRTFMSWSRSWPLLVALGLALLVRAQTRSRPRKPRAA